MNVVFRDAGAADADAVAALHASSWRSAYRGILSREFLDDRADDNRRVVWRSRLAGVPPESQLVRVAVQDARIVGLACAFLDADQRWGALLDNLHVDPAARGRSIGRRLMAQVAAWVVDRAPASSLYLWVYEENRSARAFYERFSGVAVERVLVRAPDDNDVPVVRYAWTDVPALAARTRVAECFPE